MPTVVIGTAGHIDHGKTSLLRALTGIDADRLPEERARGMTIDVGYAHLVFDDGVELDFVDVPGHEGLIGNMLVGAGEIDGAMLVVAADDGPRPQTIEHLQLLDALGIGAGLAVVTKIDVVEPARVAEVDAAVRGLLVGTSLAGAPIVTASSVTGQGLETVRAALRALRDAIAAREPDAGADPLGQTASVSLAVDRVFAVKGRGTVVTGTLRGSLERGATLRREPGGEAVHIRGLQVHNHGRDRHDGGRTALNVTGLPAEALRRGDVLTAGLGFAATDRLLVELRASAGPATPRIPGAGASLRLHVGTDQVGATMRRSTARPSAGLLTLERPIATAIGDRAVLREPASGGLVAGATVIDLRPPRGVSRRRMTAERLERLSAAIEAGNATEASHARVDLHGAAIRADGRLAFADDVRASLEAAAVDGVAAHHREAALSAGLPLARARSAMLGRLRSLATVERRDLVRATAAVSSLLDDLVARGVLVRDGDALRDPAHETARPPALVAAMDRLETALSVPAPPSLDVAAAEAGCPPDGVRALVAEGRIVRLGPDLAWSTETYHRLAALALEMALRSALTPAAYRDATRTSRKFALAILEDLDRRGILARGPAGHVPGPRAPRHEGEPT